MRQVVSKPGHYSSRYMLCGVRMSHSVYTANGPCSSKWPPRTCGEVGQLPLIILWRNRFVRRKMPSHANCVVLGCPNRKDHCKWGLFPSEEDVQGRKVYVKRCLCGSTLNKDGCGNTSLSCKSVSFHRLPKDVGAFHLWFTASLIVYNIVAGSHLNRLDESSLK